MVKKYTWDDSISTGDRIIDLQHKQFFAVLYDFAEAIEAGRGGEELKKAIIFLKYYGEWHFGSEENAFACYHCPLAGNNIEAHGKYMETINSLLEEIRNTGATQELAISSYDKLTDWLVNHIMKIDKANADFMNARKAERPRDNG